MHYLCYDIRGIQRYIFAVPRLKLIVGGSTQIAKFDRRVGRKGYCPGWTCIYSGGGRGGFRLDGAEDMDQSQVQSKVNELEQKLVQEAHRDKGNDSFALDIQIGDCPSLKDAAEQANRLFPYFPTLEEGYPCPLSGLYPVELSADGVRDRPHPTIRHRQRIGKQDELGKWILSAKDDTTDDAVQLDLESLVRHEVNKRNEAREPDQRLSIRTNLEWVFFRNVNPEPIDGDSDEENDLDQFHAETAWYCLGARNRFAVLSMDVNDLGKQQDLVAPADLETWFKVMSQAMRECTFGAFAHALAHAIASWMFSEFDREGSLDECCIKDDRNEFVTNENGDRILVLPFRPLILAGDQLTMLIHCEHAIQFVYQMVTKFEELTRQKAEEEEKANNRTSNWLWPASGKNLTISAGVLFCKVSLPLHVAIPYADSLLNSAKGRYRIHKPENNDKPSPPKPTPAAVDFDVVTDTMIDTPAERRRRDLSFEDREIRARVYLTNRPYHFGREGPRSWSALQDLTNELSKLPQSVRSDLVAAMRRPWSERSEFLISLAKKFPKIKELFFNQDDPKSNWFPEPDPNDGSARYFTGLADAAVLLDEVRRSDQGMTVWKSETFSANIDS